MKHLSEVRQVSSTRQLALAIALTTSAALMSSGCTSMSGLGGSSSYACKAPEGVTCESVSGTYANAVQNNLPSQRRKADAGTSSSAVARPTEAVANAAAADANVTAALRTIMAPAPAAQHAPMPLRSSARILRLWFKPWEDADRDLHDQGYVYIRVDDGQWLVEHAQQRIRDAFAPLRPPPRASAAGAEPREAAAPALPRRPPGPLLLPGLAPPAGRPPAPAEPTSTD